MEELTEKIGKGRTLIHLHRIRSLDRRNSPYIVKSYNNSPQPFSLAACNVSYSTVGLPLRGSTIQAYRSQKSPRAPVESKGFRFELNFISFMLYKSPVWRLALYRPVRQARPLPLRPLMGTRDRIPRPSVTQAEEEPLQFVNRDDVIRMQDVRIRMALRGVAAETVEEVVRARKEIWGGKNGREFT